MKRRTLFPVLMTLAVLIVCACVPAFFVRDEEEPPVSTAPAPLTADGKASLYSLGASGGTERLSIEDEDVSDRAAANRETIDSAMKALRLDASETENIVSVGTNYYAYADEQSRTINVMEFYREWTGDWKNWFIIQLDLDTGMMYHAYLSGICRRNVAGYLSDYGWGSADSDETAEKISQMMCSVLGLEEISVTPSDSSHYVLLCRDGGGELTYDLHLSVYHDAAPSLLVDIELTLMPSRPAGEGDLAASSVSPAG